MSAVVATTLLVLALIDSTSIGTLLIPLWLLTSPGTIRAGRVIAYLTTLALFYWVAGALLLAGASGIVELLDGVGDSRSWIWGQLALGIGLLVLGFRLGAKKDGDAEPARVARWRSRVVNGESSLYAVVGLALVGGTAEIATMLPYLGAIGILTASDLGWGMAIISLGAYCLVMITPALLLLAGRMMFGSFLETWLERFERWLSRNAAEAAGWIVGIVGFLIARDAAARLGLLDQFARFLDRI